MCDLQLIQNFLFRGANCESRQLLTFPLLKLQSSSRIVVPIARLARHSFGKYNKILHANQWVGSLLATRYIMSMVRY